MAEFAVCTSDSADNFDSAGADGVHCDCTKNFHFDIALFVRLMTMLVCKSMVLDSIVDFEIDMIVHWF